MLKWAGLAAVAVGIGACASSSDEITPQYVSPLNYQHYSCTQLRQEGQRVSQRASELAGTVDNYAKDDAILTGVAVVLFWPAVFFVEGDGAEASEYARLKGERDAIESAAIEKDCSIQFADQPS